MMRDRGIYTLDDCTIRDSSGGLRYPWGYPDGKGDYWAGAPPFPTTNLVSHWAMEQSYGDVIDSHGDHNGTNFGATRGVTGKTGYCFSFDGNNNYVTFGNSSDFNSWGSLNLWYNTDTIDSSQDCLIGVWGGNNSNRWSIKLDSDELGSYNLMFYNNSSGWKGIADTSTGEWHMITITQDSGDFYLYHDNNLTQSFSDSFGSGSSEDLTIGAFSSSLDYHYSGKIDEVSIWSNSLTDEERANLYNDGDGIAY